uniref:TauD/TfdA-like domain-containing protein n=1 Tax=Panagrolaimus sp. PS1159 TaxID=55785 RepID=A0AC35FWZ3_9BILA
MSFNRGRNAIFQAIQRGFAKARINIIHRNISSIHNDTNNRWLKISFIDGNYGIFPYVWLRDTSLESSTYSISDSMKARNLMMRDFDVEVVPKSLKLDKEKNELKILWPGNIESW